MEKGKAEIRVQAADWDYANGELSTTYAGIAEAATALGVSDAKMQTRHTPNGTATVFTGEAVRILAEAGARFRGSENYCAVLSRG